MSRAKPETEPAETEPRADFLPGKEPTPEVVEPLAEKTERIVVREDRALIGQVVHQAGTVLAEVRLAHGVTLDQLCAAIAQRKAGPGVSALD